MSKTVLYDKNIRVSRPIMAENCLIRYFFHTKAKKRIATYGKEIQLYQPLSGMRKHFIISCKLFCLHSDTVDTLRTTRVVLGSTSIRWPTGTSWPPNWPLLSFLRSDFFWFNKMNPYFSVVGLIIINFTLWWLKILVLQFTNEKNYE